MKAKKINKLINQEIDKSNREEDIKLLHYYEERRKRKEMTMTQEDKDRERLNRLRVIYKSKAMYLKQANHLLDSFDMFGIPKWGLTEYRRELLTKLEGDARLMDAYYEDEVIEELSSHDEH